MYKSKKKTKKTKKTGKCTKVKKHKKQGAPGFEPGTSRSAVECSTTELYPQMVTVNRPIVNAFCIARAFD